MNTEYYIVEDGERRGPFSIDTLKSRGLGRETLVWRQGLTEWTRADQLPELTDLFAAEESAFGTYAEAQPQPQTEPYFAMLGNTRIGPLMPQELAAHGITAETPVWRNGMAEWMPASTQPELMQAISMRQAAQAPPAPGYGQPYGQPSYTQSSYSQSTYGSQYPVQHQNWLTWAIIGTVVGFLFSCIGGIFGIIGIVQANKANNEFAIGNEIGGNQANSSAKTMTIISLVFGGLGLISNIIFFATVGLAGLASL